MRQVERIADSIRRRWAEEFLRPFRGRTKEEDNAKARGYYSRHRLQERYRARRYQANNPDRKRVWDATRRLRMDVSADGTVTDKAIRSAKRTAKQCAYCGGRLLRKQTDHMIPLTLGGAHSMRNIVIVCPDCNARKARLSYEEWVDRVEPQHRERVLALWRERYGAVAA
jgi:5-methylcytosine-specific restriction endonuclease McrA